MPPSFFEGFLQQQKEERAVLHAPLSALETRANVDLP